MQVLIPCLIFLAVENVQLVQNEHLDAQEVLDSTQFKNAVAKELLKKKLSTLESARQQDSLVTFLRKGGKSLSGLRNAPKSSFHKDDDPSRKQAQMANTFIASSNLLFGTKSQQRKACNTGGKSTNKEVLDMQSLRQTHSGYNEDGNDFMAPKEVPKLALDKLNDSISRALKKRSYSKKGTQDPISCYLTEPKKVTCMHKDIIYKIALPSSEVADDEIGRIVESIYRAVEGKNSGKASLDESIEGAPSQKTSLKDEETGSKNTAQEDTSKKKRASEDYLRSLFLNNLLVGNHKVLPNYNGNSQVFIPLLIPMTQPKIDAPKALPGYYSGMAIDPRLQIPMNWSVGVDPVSNYQTGRNLMFDNGYGQYLVPDGLALPELNLKQRSQVNLTAEEEKRRNWLALMATNGLVPVENGVNPKGLIQQSAKGEIQSVAEEKDSVSSGNKLSVAETGVVLDKLLNERQQRDTYFVRRQLRKKPIIEEKPALTPFYGDGRKHVLTKVVQKLSEPGGYLWEEKKGCPCPCPCPSDLCASSKSPRKPTKCAPKFPPKMNFPFTTTQPLKGLPCCSSTNRCATTKKCTVTCPDGCQPIPSSQCETTSCNPCSTKFNMCGDSDILSRVVSGSMTSNEKAQAQDGNSLQTLVQASNKNWLPYSPQFIPQNQPQYTGQSHQPGQQQSKSQNDQANGSPYFASDDGELQYSSIANRQVSQYHLQSKDALLAKSGEQFDKSRISNQQEQYSGPFQQQEQPQFSAQTNLVRNQIRVNYKHLPLDHGKNIYGSAQAVEGAVSDMGFKMNESQDNVISQIEHNTTASRQNDAKTKKHRDSFFARLRSKFHKEIPPNGTDQENQYNQSQHIQKKVLLGTSIFKFNPRNQSVIVGKNNTSTGSQSTETQQQCSEEQINQSNDKTTTLANQTQPSTVNNINITITSAGQPCPGSQGQLKVNNQTNQPPQSSKNNSQCPNRNPPTARAASNCQNSRTCKVTKIWLCSQRSYDNLGPLTNDSCTQRTTCQTNQTAMCPISQTTACPIPQTTACQTTQATCTTKLTTSPLSTCNISQSTLQTSTTTSCSSTSTQLSTCNNSWNLDSSNDSQPTDSFEGVKNITQPSTCGGDTPAPPTCGSDKPLGSMLPQPENPWSTGDSRIPPGIPGPPPDSSQERPGAKIKTFYYGPYPVWNQWQYPADRMNPHPPELNLNWQHQTRVPLPTPYVPQVPSSKQPDQRVPLPTPFKGPYQKQDEHKLPTLQPRPQQAYWHQNIIQPPMYGPAWNQASSRQLELDPRWQNVNSGFPNTYSGNDQGSPMATGFQFRQGQNANHYEQNERHKSNKTMVGDTMRMTRKLQLPTNIKQHIARVRRYLLKKRSKMSKQPLVASPSNVKITLF